MQSLTKFVKVGHKLQKNCIIISDLSVNELWFKCRKYETSETVFFTKSVLCSKERMIYFLNSKNKMFKDLDVAIYSLYVAVTSYLL